MYKLSLFYNGIARALLLSGVTRNDNPKIQIYIILANSTKQSWGGDRF